MKLVIISDTHTNQFSLPDGDILIHCGDHTYHGNPHETYESLRWLSEIGKFKCRLLIAGNHEVGWEEHNNHLPVLKQFPNLIYLENSGIEIDGIKFWGSPVQPFFFNWAYQKQRGIELIKHWAKIPVDTDVLITHGPPKGFGDTNQQDSRFGDEDLLQAVLRVKPDIHCYGHAHHGYGQWFFEGTQFINAAVLNEGYKLQNPPVEVEYN